MLDDARVRLIVTRQHLAERLPPSAARHVCVDSDAPAIARADDHNPTGGAGRDNLAYVLYTSGSTGRPKGVVQDHRNVLFQARAHAADHRLGPDDRLSLVSSFSFDASVTDLYGALVTGAAVVPIDVRRHGVGRLAAMLAARGVTVLHATPTVYRHLLGAMEPGEALAAIRLVLLGGEEVTARDVELGRRHLAAGCVIVNGYGATEISFALRNPIGPADPVASGPVPLGWPLSGVEVALVAPDGEPAGPLGEIEVRSRHVALGYWNDPELTAERFRTLPDGRRAYRTGDVGRRLPDGRIAFAGRRDRQVKVRGHRVELGEVEACLAAVPEVGAAVAVPWADGIAAYVVPARGRRCEPGTLRAALERTLPAFALPASVTVLDALPLTPTGKVDARALPPPAAPTAGGGAPRDDLERAVAEAWCAALGLPEVGLDDRFADLGGSSLLMADVQRRLERALDVEIPLHRLFEHATVASLAAHLRGGAGAAERLDLVEARSALRRRARAGRR
jgi:amino acid adenylation domain-containing protein